MVHLDGATPYNGFPASGQQAVENFVQAGGGYITSGWMAFTVGTGYDGLMPDFQFLNYDGGIGSGAATYTKLLDHPILLGVPNQFATNTDGDQAGTVKTYATNPVQKIMASSTCGSVGCQNGADTAGVFVRQVGNGRAVMFGFVAHWLGGRGAVLSDPNVQKLFVNAASWACK
jgi:hypothetical protein